MKKIYEKPNLTMFSLVGNENICGGCTLKLSENTTLNETIAFLLFDADGILTRAEASNVFGNGEDGCVRVVDNYCKFTSSGNVSWS